MDSVKIWLPSVTLLLLASSCGGGNSTAGNSTPSDPMPKFTLVMPTDATERTRSKVSVTPSGSSQIQKVVFDVVTQPTGQTGRQFKIADDSAPFEIDLGELPAGAVNVTADAFDSKGYMSRLGNTFFVKEARTTIRDGIINDTTWTKANSPYFIENSAYIDGLATLKIEPGVTIRGGDLKNYGQIIAIGTKDDPIVVEGYIAAAGPNFSGPASTLIRHAILRTGLVHGGYYDRSTLVVEDSIIDPFQPFIEIPSHFKTTLSRNVFKSTQITLTGSGDQSGYAKIKNNLFLYKDFYSINFNFNFGGFTSEISGNTFDLPSEKREVFAIRGRAATKPYEYIIENNYFNKPDNQLEDYIYDSQDNREVMIDLNFRNNLKEPALSTPSIESVR